jgi:hypothetical protein
MYLGIVSLFTLLISEENLIHVSGRTFAYISPRQFLSRFLILIITITYNILPLFFAYQATPYKVGPLSTRHGVSSRSGWRKRPLDVEGSCEYIE